jgi:hypothetical protein
MTAPSNPRAAFGEGETGDEADPTQDKQRRQPNSEVHCNYSCSGPHVSPAPHCIRRKKAAAAAETPNFPTPFSHLRQYQPKGSMRIRRATDQKIIKDLANVRVRPTQRHGLGLRGASVCAAFGRSRHLGTGCDRSCVALMVHSLFAAGWLPRALYNGGPLCGKSRGRAMLALQLQSRPR